MYLKVEVYVCLDYRKVIIFVECRNIRTDTTQHTHFKLMVNREG